MSTLTISDELYQRATEAAAALGKTVDEFVDESLRKALSMVGVRRTVRNGLPVVVVSDDTPPSIPLQKIFQGRVLPEDSAELIREARASMVSPT